MNRKKRGNRLETKLFGAIFSVRRKVSSSRPPWKGAAPFKGRQAPTAAGHPRKKRNANAVEPFERRRASDLGGACGPNGRAARFWVRLASRVVKMRVQEKLGVSRRSRGHLPDAKQQRHGLD